MSKGFSKLDNPAHEGKTNTWLTPLHIVNALGSFDMDPCGVTGHQTADRLICLPDCGLEREWTGRVWLNPPYGREIGTWLKKLQTHGNGIALVFSRTDTNWYQDLKPDLTFFLKGRIKFLNEKLEEETNAGHGSVLLAFGRQNAGAILSSELKGVWVK